MTVVLLFYNLRSRTYYICFIVQKFLGKGAGNRFCQKGVPR